MKPVLKSKAEGAEGFSGTTMQRETKSELEWRFLEFNVCADVTL